MSEHSAWQPVHLGAKMGLTPYFEKANEDGLLKKLVDVSKTKFNSDVFLLMDFLISFSIGISVRPVNRNKIYRCIL